MKKHWLVGLIFGLLFGNVGTGVAQAGSVGFPNDKQPRLVLPDAVAAILLDAGAEAVESGHEQIWCLTGRIDDEGDYHVELGYKPKQRAVNMSINGAVAYQQWLVIQDETCPTNTIADFHTHPVETPASAFPSTWDRKTMRRDTLNLHLISYPSHNLAGDAVVAIASYIRIPGTNEFSLLYPGG